MRTLLVLGTVLVAVAACGSGEGDDTSGSVEPEVPSSETYEIVKDEEAAQTGGMTAAEEFEAAMLAGFIWIEANSPETLTNMCAAVDLRGAEGYAWLYGQGYDPSMLPERLPYNHEGAVQAFETWCSL
jgi:hypothetical protein